MGPMRHPPTRHSSNRRDLPLVLYTHPFELALGAALALNGIRGIFGSVSPSLETLPAIPLGLYVVVSTIGGIGVITGILLGGNDLTAHRGLGMSLERAGLFCVASAYLGLAVLLLSNNGDASITTAVVYVVIGAGCLLRTRAIRRAARIIIEQLRYAHQTTPGGTSERDPWP